MKTEIADMWIEWLLDPNNKQTQGRLRKDYPTGPEYCCLGGLCELFLKHNPDSGYKFDKVLPKAATTEGIAFMHKDDIDRLYISGGTLPEVVIAWAGMNSYNGSYGPRDHALSEDNDNHNHSFVDIAMTIKKYKDEL